MRAVSATVFSPLVRAMNVVACEQLTGVVLVGARTRECADPINRPATARAASQRIIGR
jgi:hypothetical protein